MHDEPTERTVADGDSHQGTAVETASGRKKIVIVGLGMVAISFMYVALFGQIDNDETLTCIVRN